MIEKPFPRYFTRIGGFIQSSTTGIIYIRCEDEDESVRVRRNGRETPALRFDLEQCLAHVQGGGWTEITENEARALHQAPQFGDKIRDALYNMREVERIIPAQIRVHPKTAQDWFDELKTDCPHITMPITFGEEKRFMDLPILEDINIPPGQFVLQPNP